jgi:rRNA-processing protein FCF1
MKVLINDANILIDLVKLELLEVFSNLDFELYSTDFVIEELNRTERKEIDVLIFDNKLSVIETELFNDFKGIDSILARTSGLSFEDCSVWYYSKKMNGILLTGDGKLRKQARKDNIDVRGIIYIFDKLIEQELISYGEAIIKMKYLTQINVRLPIEIINKRLNAWELNNNCG